MSADLARLAQLLGALALLGLLVVIANRVLEHLEHTIAP